jgi:hypothetical protein
MSAYGRPLTSTWRCVQVMTSSTNRTVREALLLSRRDDQLRAIVPCDGNVRALVWKMNQSVACPSDPEEAAEAHLMNRLELEQPAVFLRHI